MDYPAAHSMDTTWFAVDADGHVAAFVSGEGGGVPTLAYVGDDAYDLADRIRELPETGAKLDLDGHIASSFDGTHTKDHWRKPGYELIAFVADVSAVQDLVARLGATVSPATTGHVLRFEYRDAAAFDELHARGACTYCQPDLDEQGELAAHGVYRYECPEAIAAPYARVAVPAEPLTVAAAPSHVLAHAIRFGGKFAETPQLQPAEHWKTDGWSSGWVATDGKTLRPFPGKEREFAKDVDDDNYGDADYVIVRNPIERPEGELVVPAPPKKKPWWKPW